MTITMTEEFLLDEPGRSAKALVKGEKYEVEPNHKALSEYGMKGWVVINGKYLEHSGKMGSYALTFTAKEFKQIKKISTC